MRYILRIAIIILWTSINSSLLFAQPGVTRLDDIPVTKNGQSLPNPWTGGFNNPHFGEIDLNNDGTKDLVVFDRSDNRVLTFVNNGNSGSISYDYAPSYEKHFPDMSSWMQVRDMNCDGVNDILTSKGQNNAGLFLGAYNASDEVVFQADGTLMKETQNGLSRIYVEPMNIPAFNDINNDGDIDILTFEQIENSFIEYYENQSLELTGSCGDSVIFKIKDDCWGNIYESGLQRTATIRDTCGSLIVPKAGSNAHAGASLLAFDEDGDNVQDLLMGSLSFNTINRLENIGTPDTARIGAQDTLFPSYGTSIDLPFYPATFHFDVNNDGVDDLLVSPNDRNGASNFTCAWYYENTGSMNNQTFSFRTDTFLVNDMLDFGEGAYPAFFDYNNDGKQDLVVGNYGYFSTGSFESSFALLENTSSSGSISFELVTTDFSGLRSSNLQYVTPTFGDLDDDGQAEMITGREDGSLVLYDNTGSGGTANFTLQTVNYKNINVPQFSAPLLHDANGDGLLDLIVGNKQAKLQYFENIGTASSADFNSTPTNNFLGEIDVSGQNFLEGFSIPRIARLDSTNQLYLLVGSKKGNIHLYEFDSDSLTEGSFPLVTDDYTQTYHGRRTAPAVAELTGDQEQELVVGNYRGGLQIYSQADSIKLGQTPKSSSADFSIYPNPASSYLNIELGEWGHNQDVRVRILDMQGRLKRRNEVPHGKNRMQLQFDDQWAAGLYFIEVRSSDKQEIRKFILQ